MEGKQPDHLERRRYRDRERLEGGREEQGEGKEGRQAGKEESMIARGKGRGGAAAGGPACMTPKRCVTRSSCCELLRAAMRAL